MTMKRTIILLTFIFAVSATFAQKGKVTSAQNLKGTGKLDKAYEAIESAVDPSNEKAEKSIPWPKTWEVRGEVYQAIFASKDENFNKLSDNPLTVAFDSYKKAIELDTKKKNAKSIKIKLTLLANDFTNQAVQAFQDNDYDKALVSFEQIIEIQNIDIVKADNPNAIDTVILFNAGLAAYNGKNYEKAIKYYTEVAEYGYNGAKTYSLIAESYKLNNDTLGALEALKTGFEKYPEDNGVLTSMIQIYLDMKKTDDAMKYLEMAISQDPDNTTYYFAQGRLYEDMGEETNAIATYEKSLEIDPSFFNGNYNLGALYYNKGVQQIEVANGVPANENAKYEAELKKADVWFEKSLPFMEKCDELQANDPMTMDSLKNLYYRLKKMDKYNAILEKLEQ